MYLGTSLRYTMTIALKQGVNMYLFGTVYGRV